MRIFALETMRVSPVQTLASFAAVSLALASCTSPKDQDLCSIFLPLLVELLTPAHHAFPRRPPRGQCFQCIFVRQAKLI